jgi:hypothetical protein
MSSGLEMADDKHARARRNLRLALWLGLLALAFYVGFFISVSQRGG